MIRFVTKESIQEKIGYEERKIQELEDKIQACMYEIDEQKALLERLNAHEATPIEERTLRKGIYSDTKTVKLFDEFETKTEDGFRKYDRLIITNGAYGPECSYQHIVELHPEKDCVGRITATDFKLGHVLKLSEYIDEQIIRYMKTHKLSVGEEIIFDKPYRFSAQNKSNRTGYGSVYNGEDLIYEGTYYGETDPYAFTGVVIIHVNN